MATRHRAHCLILIAAQSHRSMKLDKAWELSLEFNAARAVCIARFIGCNALGNWWPAPLISNKHSSTVYELHSGSRREYISHYKNCPVRVLSADRGREKHLVKRTSLLNNLSVNMSIHQTSLAASAVNTLWSYCLERPPDRSLLYADRPIFSFRGRPAYRRWPLSLTSFCFRCSAI